MYYVLVNGKNYIARDIYPKEFKARDYITPLYCETFFGTYGNYAVSKASNAVEFETAKKAREYLRNRPELSQFKIYAYDINFGVQYRQAVNL